MVCPKGIFVFESKNYSGYVFGNERHEYWTQTLPGRNGRTIKHHFYNPIIQNRNHIKYLQQFLRNALPIWSIIVFSDRCTLKSISIQSCDTIVINLRVLPSLIYSIFAQL